MNKNHYEPLTVAWSEHRDSWDWDETKGTFTCSLHRDLKLEFLKTKGRCTKTNGPLYSLVL